MQDVHDVLINSVCLYIKRIIKNENFLATPLLKLTTCLSESGRRDQRIRLYLKKRKYL